MNLILLYRKIILGFEYAFMIFYLLSKKGVFMHRLISNSFLQYQRQIDMISSFSQHLNCMVRNLELISPRMSINFKYIDKLSEATKPYSVLSKQNRNILKMENDMLSNIHNFSHFTNSIIKQNSFEIENMAILRRPQTKESIERRIKPLSEDAVFSEKKNH